MRAQGRSWSQHLPSRAAGDRTTDGDVSEGRLGPEAEAWDLMVSIWPDYAEYSKITEREIPVVILERVT
jgi:hypothetical protein